MDEQVARRRRKGRVSDAALADERLGEPAPDQVVEDWSGKPIRVELCRAIEMSEDAAS
jgi:hypothetical protein